jgi:hypothetical protein
MHTLRYTSSLSSVLRMRCASAQHALRPASLTLRRTIISESSAIPLLHIRPEQSFYTCAPAKRYTSDHEVITFDDERGVGTVSITDYAQKSLGDVVFVELPQAGTKIEQGGESLVGIRCPRPVPPGI